MDKKVVDKIVSNGLMLVNDMIEKDLGDTCIYCISDKYEVEITIGKDAAGEVDYYAFTMIKAGYPTEGTCGTGPIDDYCLRKDMHTAISCGLRDDIAIDVKALGSIRPQRIKGTNRYSIPRGGVSVVA